MMTTEQLEAEISAITTQLETDTRPVRPTSPDEPGAVVRKIQRAKLDDQGQPVLDADGNEVLFEVGQSIELATAEAHRAERRALKDRRKAIRRELELRAFAAESATPPRAIAEIEADITELTGERGRVLEDLRVLNRERDRAVLLAELAAMPDSKREALRQLLGPSGVPSGEAIGKIGA